jgi:hypothetical protein
LPLLFNLVWDLHRWDGIFSQGIHVGGRWLSLASCIDSLLLTVDDVILLASFPKGLLRQIDALSSFCGHRQLVVDLSKTKVMVFNVSKSSLLDYHFYFRGSEIESVHIFRAAVFNLLLPLKLLPRRKSPNLNGGA